jgi:hypothetical protein
VEVTTRSDRALMELAAREAGFTPAETQKLLADVSSVEPSGYGTYQAHFLVRGTPLEEVVDRVQAALTAQTGSPARESRVGKSRLIESRSFPSSPKVLVRPSGDEVLVMGIDGGPISSGLTLAATVAGLGGIAFGAVFGLLGLLIRLPALALLAVTVLGLAVPIWLTGLVGRRMADRSGRRRLAQTLTSIRALVLEQP